MSDTIDTAALQKQASISLSDLESILTETSGAKPLREPSITNGGTAYDDYRRYGSFLSSDALKDYFNFVLDESYRLMGLGTSRNVLQNFLSRLDRHGTAMVPLNTMNYGYTFITRPRLNLTSANLVQNPILNTLYANDGNSVAFMIRALLDTRLCRGEPLFRGGQQKFNGITEEAQEFVAAVEQSGLVDKYNPFFVPLCNGLKGMSGFPDFTIETETTEGDFFSGDFTFAKGSDMLNRTQELSLEFRDVNGSIILSCIYYWLVYIALVTRGIVMAYPDDIYEQRLNYTVSIYRFIMDPTRRTILWWGKATGCFPKAAPIGAMFNINQGEVTISSAGNFSIPFVANHVAYNDPGIILDFNRLMERYCPGIKDEYQVLEENTLSPAAGINFAGLPYIVPNTNRGMQLVWKTNPAYLESAGISSIAEDEVNNEDKWAKFENELREARVQELYRALEAIGAIDQNTGNATV